MHKQIMIAALLLLAGCGEAPTSQTTGGAAMNQLNTSGAVITDVPAQPPVPFGKTGSGEGYEVTISSVEQRSNVGSMQTRKAGPDETYVIIFYKLTNTGSRPMLSEDRPKITLLDGNGQAQVEDGAAGLYFAEDGLGDAMRDMNANVSANRASVWKVAKAAFDKATWKVGIENNSVLTFALQ